MHGREVDACRGQPTWTISTSYVERQNLTMVMHMRCFRRTINGLVEKTQKHAKVTLLHFMYYNIVCIQKALRNTLTMAPGMTE